MIFFLLLSLVLRFGAAETTEYEQREKDESLCESLEV